MKVFLGADHQGYHLKEKIEVYLTKRKYQIEDVGANDLDPNDDFPQFAQMAATKLLGEESSADARAILVCGGGQGMAMAANRFRGIRASVIWDSEEARMTRRDTNSNILCLPARVLSSDDQLWKDIIDTWLSTPFSEVPRYRRRNDDLDRL